MKLQRKKMNFFNKLIMKINRYSWSTIIPIISYFIFILLIINFTLPIKQSKMLSKHLHHKNNQNNENDLNKSTSFLNNNQRKFLIEPKTVILANSIDEKHILQKAFNE